MSSENLYARPKAGLRARDVEWVCGRRQFGERRAAAAGAHQAQGVFGHRPGPQSLHGIHGGEHAHAVAVIDFGHLTTIIIPGTSRTDALPPGDLFPLRIRIQKAIDQIRSISNGRFKFRYCKVQPSILKKVEEALRSLTGR